jgi:hypothetical protein
LTASTNDARDKLGQLQTVIEYLGKPSSNQGLKVIPQSLNNLRLLTGKNGKVTSTLLESLTKSRLSMRLS